MATNGKWDIGQIVEIYDRPNRQWVEAEIVQIFTDKDGEWIKIDDGEKESDIPSDSPEIRILSNKQNDNELMEQWKVGTLCELYNQRERKWVDSEVIHTFSDSAGSWLRIQSGARIQDVFIDDIERNVRARGTSHLAVSVRDISDLKDIVARYPATAAVLERIFAKSGGFTANVDDISYEVDKLFINL